MKKFFIYSLMFLVLILFVFSATGQNIIVNSDVSPGWFRNTFNFFHENWIIIALIASEIAAFLPTKINGIIHAIIKVGQSIFRKTNSKT